MPKGPPPKVDQDRRRFDNLVELVGTVQRCPDCKRRGFLAKVSVRVTDNHTHRKRYRARWEHPDDDGGTAIHPWEWPPW